MKKSFVVVFARTCLFLSFISIPPPFSSPYVGSQASRRLIDCFADLLDLRHDRSRLLSYFPRADSAQSTVQAGEIEIKIEAKYDEEPARHGGQEQNSPVNTVLAETVTCAGRELEVDLALIDHDEQAWLWQQIKRRRKPNSLLHQTSLCSFFTESTGY